MVFLQNKPFIEDECSLAIYNYKREKIANRKAVHLEGLIVGTIVLIVGLFFYLIYTAR